MRRNFTLSKTFSNREEQLQELDRIAKRLVRRDFELMQTNEAMRLLDEEKAKHEALLSSIGDGVVATDTEEKIIFINKAAEELIGWSAQDSIGKDWFSFVPVEDERGEILKREERPIQLTLSSGRKTSNNTYQYVRKDGARVPVSITVAPIILNGKTTGAVVVFRDVTEEKAIDKAKSEFVSLASHQLKTPLSIIKWYTEMLLSVDVKRLSATQKKYIQKLYGANERMIKLVKALLNVSRIELGALLIEPEPINLKDVAEGALEELYPAITAKQLNVTTNYDPKLPTINADKKLIRIVFQNLLSNAVKYTPRDGRISLSIEKQTEDMLITVTDTGYGIPKKQQSKIFKKLFRADNAQAIDPDGTGLGLYIVKSVLDQSGGSITFDSAKDKGSSFYVSIPLSGMKQKEGTKRLV